MVLNNVKGKTTMFPSNESQLSLPLHPRFERREFCECSLEITGAWWTYRDGSNTLRPGFDDLYSYGEGCLDAPEWIVTGALRGVDTYYNDGYSNHAIHLTKKARWH